VPKRAHHVAKFNKKPLLLLQPLKAGVVQHAC
jgi:hypothetical protein